MHEIKLIESIISILNREVEDPAIGEVKTIHLEIGRLRRVVPEIMESCFPHVPKNDKLKTAKIKITELPIRVRCSKCGYEEEIKDYSSYDCKKCSNKKTEIISGNEFLIKGIEY